MRLVATIIFALWAPISFAQTINVASGDHADFTRLVLTFPKPPDWSLQKVETGYALTSGVGPSRYDLSRVYERISKFRLASIMVDPVSGALVMGVNCACHALPFDFRPGIVVIDIVDGPAPSGSVFETILDDPSPLRATTLPTPRPQQRMRASDKPVHAFRTTKSPDLQDAFKAAARTVSSVVTPPIPLTEEEPAPQLDQLRAALLREIGNGASEGVIEFVDRLPKSEQKTTSGNAELQMRLGMEAGLDANARERGTDQMTAEGAACLPDQLLDMSNWGSDAPVAQSLGLVFSALVGEFDRPNPEAVTLAVRYLLHIGFGQEALQLLRGLEIASPDRAVFESLAHIVEDDRVPGSVFAGMEVCDGAAALWAVLALPHPQTGDNPKVEAVKRTFSSLPLELRRHLGPGLAERFLSQGDVETARGIRDAIVRAAGDAGGAVRLMEAQIEMAHDPENDGQDALAPLMAEPGLTGIDASVALVHATVKVGGIVDPAVITRLQSDLFEAKGSQREAELLNAIALALATQNQFQAAFEIHEDAPQHALDIWGILSRQGSDSELLQHAIRPIDETLPDLGPETETRLAERLLNLGFSAAALRWLDSDRRDLNDADRLIAARAQIQRRDPNAALDILAGQTSSDAGKLRAEAFAIVGDPEAAAIYQALDADSALLALARRNQNWAEVVKLAPDDPWGAAAALVASEAARLTDAETGPLKDGRAAIAESAASRATLEALLRESRMPELND
jgi:hypothetical protein